MKIRKVYGEFSSREAYEKLFCENEFRARWLTELFSFIQFSLDKLNVSLNSTSR